MMRPPRGLARYIVRRPWTLPVFVRAAWALRKRRWWSHPPFLPVPGEEYWAFRELTAFGDEASPPPRLLHDAAQWTVLQRRRR